MKDKKRDWWGTLFVVSVMLTAVVFVLWGLTRKDDVTVTVQATKDVLPGSVNVVCLEGHEYIYIEHTGVSGTGRAVMAPKFDEEGRPARCRVEKSP